MAADGISDEAVRSRLLVTVRVREWAELVDNRGVYRLTDAGLAEYRAARREALMAPRARSLYVWEQVLLTMAALMDGTRTVSRDMLMGAHAIASSMRSGHDHVATVIRKGFAFTVTPGVYQLTVQGVNAAAQLRGRE